MRRVKYLSVWSAVVSATLIASCGGGSSDDMVTEPAVETSFADEVVDEAVDEAVDEIVDEQQMLENDAVTNPELRLVTYAGQKYYLNTLLLKPQTQTLNHTIIELLISDGTPVQRLLVESPVLRLQELQNATIWLRMELYSPRNAGNSLNNGSYRSARSGEDLEGDALAGVAFFSNATLGVDLDGGGAIETTSGEVFDINLGSLDLNLVNPLAMLNFSLVLSNGVSVTGNYQGFYELSGAR